ncbi:hypothetical protein HK096_011574 [Nowakowskiella sp. JEL0078]|nr:hypothetical protein HK096_011574 [Nowakowskiella sp. JEL0078]
MSNLYSTKTNLPLFFTQKTYQESANFLKSKLPKNLQTIDIGIICGSGLGGLADLVSDKVEIEYKFATSQPKDIPHFAISTTPGHVGKLVFGKLRGHRVICMVGRKHIYEGHHVIHTTYPVRVMHSMGVQTLLVTNAAGGLNPSFHVGEFMVISDHASMPGLSALNPLIGPNIEEFGPRFPPMSDAYSLDLRVLAFLAAKKIGLPTEGGPEGRALREGVYGFVVGPSFESRAEARFLRDSLGVDVVGMSTVSEVIVARHCGMDVLGLSLVTNMVVNSKSSSAKDIAEKYLKENEVAVGGRLVKGLVDHDGAAANHEEVLTTGLARVEDFQNLVVAILELMPLKI